MLDDRSMVREELRVDAHVAGEGLFIGKVPSLVTGKRPVGQPSCFHTESPTPNSPIDDSLISCTLDFYFGHLLYGQSIANLLSRKSFLSREERGMAEAEQELQDGVFVRTLKDLFAGAAGGVAQVLLGQFSMTSTFYLRMAYVLSQDVRLCCSFISRSFLRSCLTNIT